MEETVIHTLDLPEGVDWRWYPDCNMIALSSRLDQEGRDLAILDLQATWRRKMMRVVSAAA